jgi:hypothetical protein
MEMKVLGIRFRVEIVVACLILGMIMGCHVFCSCVHTETAKKVVKESMVNLTSLDYNMSKDVPGSWGKQRKVNTISQQLDTHQGPKVPLPPGQLSFFAQTTFTPECCVPPFSGASNADGCACVTEEQVNYINARGGNNTSNHGL